MQLSRTFIRGSKLDGLTGEASAAFFRLSLSRREQSPLMNVRPSA